MTTTTRQPFFIDENKDKEFNELGYLVAGAISENSITKLIDIFTSLNIPDSYGFGFNVGLNTNEHHIRKTMQDAIKEILEPEVTKLLNNKYVFTATFMNKTPQGTHLLPAHQDWTFTDETKHDSVMCWIPLVDVDMKNGCMCFVPYSNQLFNYTRPFPFPFHKNPVKQNETKLLGFMRPEPMKMGQMVFINHKTAHASFPNSSTFDRLAVGLSIAPKDELLHVYCLNPKNTGETMFKYDVDTYFLVNYPHKTISQLYFSETDYAFSYKILLEQKYELPKLSWEQIFTFFTQKGLTYNTQLVPVETDVTPTIEPSKPTFIQRIKTLFTFIK
ncbi:MAG: phytanoyl-CoA dioxygenase family protein [Bacteroidia bacterium]